MRVRVRNPVGAGRDFLQSPLDLCEALCVANDEEPLELQRREPLRIILVFPGLAGQIGTDSVLVGFAASSRFHQLGAQSDQSLLLSINKRLVEASCLATHDFSA